IAEGCLLALGLGTAYVFSYSESSFGPSFVPARLFAPLPFLIWAALRFGAGGVSTSLLAVLLISVSYAMGGRGPFNSRSPAEDIVGLQLFLIATSVPMMVLAGVTEERRRAEAELAGSHRRTSEILESIGDAFFSLDKEFVFTYVNRRTEQFWGKRREELIGRNFLEVFPQSVGTHSYDEIMRAREDGRPVTYETFSPIIHCWVEASIYPAGGGLSVYFRDITERKRAEQALEQLTGRLLQLQDEERRRIARELHDTTAQNLLAIVLNLETLLRKASTLPQDFSDAVHECQSLCEQTQAEIRTLSYLLHPPMLDEAGLMLALEWFIDGFSRRSGLHIQFVAPPDFKRLPPQMETALFRVVQESLTNIYRHSGSTTAEIRLEHSERLVLLRITDFGRGMAAATGNGTGHGSGPPTPRVETLGVGISGMRERLRQLGGRLEVRSDGAGTSVTAVLPLGKGEDG
ncbi:MAG: histidine kinase, partial [Pyrinomonadaceae bacterium]